MLHDEIRYTLTPTEIVSRAIYAEATQQDRWTKVLGLCHLESRKTDQVQTGVWTEQEGVRMILAERLPLAILESNPLRSDDSVYAELLRTALAEVNWHTVAESLI